ncbi:MAG: hypothetical protein HZC55_22355 [Verrucomicrobia bacterium]|jgi:hypothetical protein|nr:hypothetical protein [Verrucomicrobiota bacterium]
MPYLFAVATQAQLAAGERLREVPGEVWWKLLAVVAAVIAVVTIIRKIAQMNHLLLGVALFIATTAVGFNWIYERNEPTWATPVVRILAGFFPSKGRV